MCDAQRCFARHSHSSVEKKLPATALSCASPARDSALGRFRRHASRTCGTTPPGDDILFASAGRNGTDARVVELHRAEKSEPRVDPLFEPYRRHLLGHAEQGHMALSPMLMNIYNPKSIAANVDAPRIDRPAMAVVHDGATNRLLVMRLEAGQRVARQMNPCSVTVTVLEGAGTVSGAEGERWVESGDVIVFESGEPLAMRAPDELFVLLVTISRCVSCASLRFPSARFAPRRSAAHSNDFAESRPTTQRRTSPCHRPECSICLTPCEPRSARLPEDRCRAAERCNECTPPDRR